MRIALQCLQTTVSVPFKVIVPKTNHLTCQSFTGDRYFVGPSERSSAATLMDTVKLTGGEGMIRGCLCVVGSTWIIDHCPWFVLRSCEHIDLEYIFNAKFIILYRFIRDSLHPFIHQWDPCTCLAKSIGKTAFGKKWMLKKEKKNKFR